MENYDLEIIQPVYNPPENWIEKYCSHYKELQFLFSNIKFRVILVNDGSQYNFDDVILKELKEKIGSIKIISYSGNKGKGYALRQGMKETAASYILYTDYDFPYKLLSLKNAYSKLLEGNDIVVGIRNEDYYKKLTFSRKVISKTFNLFTRMFLGLPFSDTQSGLKAFSFKGKELLMQTTIDRFLFDTELICKAIRNKKLKVATIPLELNKEVFFTKINSLIILQEIKNLSSISWRLLLRKL